MKKNSKNQKYFFQWDIRWPISGLQFPRNVLKEGK